MVRGPARRHAGAMNDTRQHGDGPHRAADDPRDDSGPRVTRSEVADLGRLRRTVRDRHVAGVAGGLGRHLDVDPVILRVAFVVLVFFGGAGLLLYGAAWLLVPEEGTEHAAIDLDARTRRLGLIVAGALGVLLALGDTWSGWGFPWPLALVALVVFVIVSRRRGSSSQAGAADTPAGQGPPARGETVADPTAEPAPATDPTADLTGTGHGGTSGYYWSPPPTGSVPAPAPAPRPRDPRRRGPLLFWATAALVVLAMGILGVVEGAGYDVPAAAYPALGLGVVGLALVLGSWWGRAGGLIALGVLLLPVLAGATVADHYDPERLHAPTTAGDLRNEHFLPAGEMVLDLTAMEDLRALDGRTLRVAVGTGRIEVVLPEDVDARIRAEIGGPGSAEVLGRESGTGGGDVLTGNHDGGADVPEIDVETWMGAGEIVVRTEER